MLPTPRPACLILADISGYTTYLAGADLERLDDDAWTDDAGDPVDSVVARSS